MAISGTAVWEIRSTGDDANGGFYTSGGTDYSQQDTAQLSVTDGVTNGTTTVTSATGGFTAAMIGNAINIAGTIYQITARASTNSITVDRATGTASGQTMKVGGARASFGGTLILMVSENRAWAASGNYTESSNISLVASASPGNGNLPNRVTGYHLVRGDNPTGSNRPIIQAATGCTSLIQVNGNGWWFEHLILDGADIATPIDFTFNYLHVIKCLIKRFPDYGLKLTGSYCVILDNEITAGTTGSTTAIGGGAPTCRILGNFVHSNPCSGILTAVNSFESVVAYNIVANNTGSSSDGIAGDGGGSYAATIIHNTVYGNGRHGISVNGFFWGLIIRNNIVANNGGSGLKNIAGTSSTNVGQIAEVDGNAYYLNTSGSYSGFVAGEHDVSLTGDPCPNAASGDYSPSAECKGVGFPGVFPGGLTTAYPDIGAVQHQDAGGGGSTVIVVDED